MSKELREQYEKETGLEAYGFISSYSDIKKPTENYSTWLEAKNKDLELGFSRKYIEARKAKGKVRILQKEVSELEAKNKELLKVNNIAVATLKFVGDEKGSLLKIVELEAKLKEREYDDKRVGKFLNENRVIRVDEVEKCKNIIEQYLKWEKNQTNN